MCDDMNNNMDCNYDGGDCCGTNVNMKNCVDCICYPQTCDGPLELISDGYCNDATNNAGCNFDGGDCCGGCADFDHCSNCVCHAGSPISHWEELLQSVSDLLSANTADTDPGVSGVSRDQ